MQLIYRERPGFLCPPMPWPARDHDEPDAAVAKAKIDSGFYRRAREAKPDERREE